MELVERGVPARGDWVVRLNTSGARVGEWVRRFWLVPLQAVLALFVGGAIAIPLLYATGWDAVASTMFKVYHLFCAQVPSHSYFLLGYQLGLCARNLAIYGSLLAGALLFGKLRERIPPLNVWLWLLTMVPMALDGFTQLFGLRESNWELRTVTGVIFGLGLCWFLLPQIHRAAADVAPTAPAAPAFADAR